MRHLSRVVPDKNDWVGYPDPRARNISVVTLGPGLWFHFDLESFDHGQGRKHPRDAHTAMTKVSMIDSEHQTGIDPRLGRHQGCGNDIISPAAVAEAPSNRGSASLVTFFTVYSPRCTIDRSICLGDPLIFATSCALATALSGLTGLPCDPKLPY